MWTIERGLKSHETFANHLNDRSYSLETSLHPLSEFNENRKSLLPCRRRALAELRNLEKALLGVLHDAGVLQLVRAVTRQSGRLQRPLNAYTRYLEMGDLRTSRSLASAVTKDARTIDGVLDTPTGHARVHEWSSRDVWSSTHNSSLETHSLTIQRESLPNGRGAVLRASLNHKYRFQFRS